MIEFFDVLAYALSTALMFVGLAFVAGLAIAWAVHR